MQPLSRILIVKEDYTLSTNVVAGSVAFSNVDDCKNNKFSTYAYTNSATPSIWFDLQRSVLVDVVSIPRHTIVSGTTWRIRLSDNPLITTSPATVPLSEVLYDSASVEVWPPDSSSSGVPFEEHAEWSSGFRGATYPPTFLHGIDTIARYVRIDFTQFTTSPLQVHKVTIGPSWRPSGGVSPNWSQRYVLKKKTHTRLKGGSVFSDDRRRIRQVSFKLKTLTELEVFKEVAVIDKSLTKKLPWLIVIDPSDDTNKHSVFLYGTQNKTSPIKNRYYGYYEKSYILDEWV